MTLEMSLLYLIKLMSGLIVSNDDGSAFQDSLKPKFAMCEMCCWGWLADQDIHTFSAEAATILGQQVFKGQHHSTETDWSLVRLRLQTKQLFVILWDSRHWLQWLQ